VEFWWRYTNVPVPLIPARKVMPVAAEGGKDEKGEGSPPRLLSVEEKIDRLADLVGKVQEELDAMRAGFARFTAPGDNRSRERRRTLWPADLPGHSTAVRMASRPAPIDHLALRRVIGRLMVRALEGKDMSIAVSVRSDGVMLDEDNELQLLPGRYSRISLRLAHVSHPDRFVEETFSACALYGCEVRNLGTGARYGAT